MPLLISTLHKQRGLIAFAAVLAAITCSTPTAWAQATYTWNQNGTAAFSTASNWTPSRSSPQATDVLVINGATTPSPTVQNIPTQTIGRLRVIGDAAVTVTSAGNSRVLTLSSVVSPALDVAAGSSLTVEGTRALEFALASGATAMIAGSLSFAGAADKLTAVTAGSITFTAGSSFTTLAEFKSNPFGSTGTANIVVFQSGSTYTHTAGADPFGLSAPASKVTFQSGSTFVVRSATGFVTEGRAYGNLTIDTNSSVSSSGSGNFQFQTLHLNTGSSFTYSGSGSSAISITGDISTAGTGSVSLISGTGAISFGGGGVRTVGGGTGSGAISLSGNVTVSNGTTLATSRTLGVAGGSVTVDGAFQLNQGGGISVSTMTYGAVGALTFNNSSGVVSVLSSTPYWPAVSGPADVSVMGAGGITMGTGALRTVPGMLRVAGPVGNAQRLTALGVLQLDSGGSMTGAPTYGSAATLLYGAGSFGVGPEWGSGSAPGVGVPRNLSIQAGAGSVTLPNSDRYVPGNLTLTSGTLALNPASGNLLVAGDWTNSGTFVNNGRSVVLYGAAQQTLFRAGGETFGVFQLAKSAGELALASDLTIANELFLSGGRVLTGGNALILGAGGTVTRSNGFVEGTFRKTVPGGAAAITFEIGSGSSYTPLSLAFGNVSGSSTLEATTSADDHPAIGTSPINPSMSVNRSWRLTGPGVGFTTYDVTLGFDASEVDPGTAISTLRVARYAAPDWSTVASGAATSTSIQATGLTAFGEFAAGQYFGNTITASAGANGTVTPSGAVAVPYGASQAFTITADPHHHITDVVVDEGSVGPMPTYTFSNVTIDHTLSAAFALDRHTVTITPGANGTVTRAPDQADYGWGSTVQLTATPASGYHFVEWGGDASGSANPLSLLVDGDKTVAGTFQINSYPLSVNLSGNGTVAKTPNQTVYDHGTVVQINAYAAAGYAFSGWSGDASGTATPAFVTMTGPRAVTASFSVESFPVLVSVVGPGTVSRNPDLTSYPYGTLVTLTATPDPGAQFLAWTGSVTGATNPITLTVDGAESATATFQGAQLDYTLSRFAGAYAPISAGSGASTLMVNAHDSTRSVPLPFAFPYSGRLFAPGNYLAVNANGFAYLARESATGVASPWNANLFTSSAPNATLAPWFDDLHVGPIGSNPGGAVLYQTQGAPGARNLTVQWTNVSSYSNANSGQPRQLNFQLVLFEETGVIEFRYGAALGSDFSTFESASIGIEDSVGGNNHYIDAITGSRLTSFGMMSSNKWPTRHVRYTPVTPVPLPPATYTVGLFGANYPSITEAVADMNHRGISGPVTISLSNAVYDTTAGGGRNVFPLLLGPVSGAGPVNTITIESNVGSVIRHRGSETGFCGNQTISNVIGNTNEPLLALVGVDWVTLSNLTFEGGLVADRGILITGSSRSDGTHHATLRDVIVRLDRSNEFSIGVQQVASVVPTSLDGTNSYNRFLNLTVENSYSGLALTGNGSLFDTDCEVGGAPGGAQKTTIGAGLPGDIGGGIAAVFGMRAVNQSRLKLRSTEVRNLSGTGSAAVDGISVETQGVLTTDHGILDISGNQVHGLRSTATNGGRVTGIRVASTANAGSFVRVYNNMVHDLSSASTSTLSRRVVGIFAQESSNGAGGTLDIDFNSVRLDPAGLASPNTCFELGTVAGPAVHVRNNVFANFTAAQSGGAKHYCWVTPAAASIGASGSVSERNALFVLDPSNGYAGRSGSTDRATLTDWRLVAGSDIYSREEDPRFQAPQNLHIATGTATPVEGTGSMFAGAIGWIADDIDGNLRITATPDMGADEGTFVPLDLYDVRAVSLIAPGPGSLRVTGTPFTPEASFFNQGIRNLSNVPVRFRIIGPQPLADTVYSQVVSIPSFPTTTLQQITFPPATIATPGNYAVEALAQLATDQRPENDLVSATIEMAAPLAGDYPVGAGRAAPFNTLSAAVARLNTVGVSASVRLLLEDASYGALESFPVTVNTVAGGNATKTVTIKPAPGAMPVVTGSSATGMVVLNGADDVIVDGSNTVGGTSRDLTLVNTNGGGTGAVVWGQTAVGNDGASRNTVKNVVARGSGNTVVGVGFGGVSISVTSNGSGNVQNRVENVAVERTQVGIYSGGSSGAGKNTGTVITGNALNAASPNHLTRAGIVVRYEDGIQITGNTIGAVAATSGDAVGIALGTTVISAAGFVGDEVVNATVSRNLVRGVSAGTAGAAGITLARASSGITTVVNNMVSGVISVPTSSEITAGIMAGGGTTRVWFNSVNLSGSRAGAVGPSLALVLGDSASASDVRDNVLVDTQSGGPGYAIGIPHAASFATLTSENNDLHTGSATVALVGGLANIPAGNRANLSAWRATTGRDLNSISADPLFTSSSDLHVTSALSMIANAGQPIAGVLTDFDGETGSRSSLPDLGADEFESWALIVQIAGSGTVERAPQQASYATGATVTLTATPAVGWHFVGWSGDASGSTNPLEVAMVSHRNLTATFEINTYTMAVTTAGSGTVAKSPNTPSYDHGTIVVLTATPAIGWHFMAWSGDTVATANPLSLAMTANRTMVATFAINTYSLAVTTAGSGSVSRNLDQPAYDHGTIVVLTATPAVGWSFTGWSGDASGTANPLNVTMTGNRAITATFTINSYTLTVNTVGSGTVEKVPNQATYTHGTTVQLLAIPAVGWTFVSWSGGATGTANPVTVAMDANQTVTATFAINTYSLAVTTVGSGTVVKNPNLAAYDHGTVVTLTATPEVGWSFTGWSGDASGTANPLNVTMTSNKTVTATFTINSYTLTVNTTGSGTVARAPNQATYTHGTTVQLTATPAGGWHFVNWSGGATGSTNPVTVTMDANQTVSATFAINTYSLAVTTSGSGSVLKAPNLLAYDHGTIVMLTATPAVGWTFTGWSGDTSGSANPLNVMMTANRSITATFTINSYTLTVNTVGNGTVQQTPNQATYTHGTTVQLLATPALGWHFASWSGGATGSTNPVTVAMDANQTVSATFEINTYPITATTIGNGSIIRDPNQATYGHGTQVTLTAVPAVGHHLEEWSGDVNGIDNPATLVMDAAKSVTASFEINTYPLTVSVTGSGSVVKNPNSAQYPYGTIVTLTATAPVGWHLAGWSGDASGTTNPLPVTMNGVKSITATFEINQYSLAVSSVGAGVVQVDPELASYAHGASVTLTAQPATGHHFLGWSGSQAGTTNPLGVTMLSDQTITATFAINTYVLSTTVVGQGSIATTPPQAAYDHGTTVTVTANPAVGWHFVAWSGAASGTVSPANVLMDGAKSVTATFAINSYALGVNAIGIGSVTKSPDQAAYDHGTTVQVAGVPDVGWHFDAWSGDASGTANPTNVVMDGAKSVTATFAINTYVLSTTVVGQGSIARTPPQAAYDHGTTVTVTANPAVGWHFVAWSGAASGTVSPADVLMDGAKSVTATFAINTYALGMNAIGSGSVTKSPDQAAYDHGTTVQVAGVPDVGWHFDAWSGDASGTANPTNVVMDGAKSVTATFAINTYVLSTTVVGQGSIASTPPQAAYDHGTTVTVTANPAVGWHFVAWSGAASGTVSAADVLMDGAKSVTATFAINTYPLEVTTNGFGSVTKSPDQAQYDHGTTVDLTAVADPEYFFIGWSGDVSGSVSPASILMEGARSVNARFGRRLEVAVAGNGSVSKDPDQELFEPGATVTLAATPQAFHHFTGWSGDASGTTNPLVLTMNGNLTITASFVIDTYALGVNAIGSGSVTKSPDQAAYDHGTTVQVAGVPDVGWHFDAWSGDASGTANPTNVVMDGAKSVTATFAINTYVLSTTVVGQGSIARTPPQAAYDHGTTVTVTANPAVGWHFVAWSGAASGTVSAADVLMDGAKSVTATFAINTYALEVTTNGSGSVTKNPDQAQYDHGTTVDLTALPAGGWHLVSWAGDASGIANPTSVLVDGPKSVTASFAINTYPLDVATSGSGSVTRSPDQPLYDHGATVEITATPATGWHFTSWAGDASGTANPTSLVMDDSLSVTAVFTLDTHPLVVSVTGSGSVTQAPDQALYDFGTTVQLKAVPATGWHFVAWSGDATGTTSPTNVLIDGPKDVTAAFEINTYTVNVSVTGSGSVAKIPDQPAYDHGAIVQLTATPVAGWRFSGWSGDAAGSTNPLDLAVDGPKDVTATFVLNQFPLAVTLVGSGSVQKNPDQSEYVNGTSVQLTATPAAGSDFSGWSGDATGVTNPVSVIMNAPKSVTATFTLQNYTLIVSSGSNGSVVKNPDQATYPYGTVVQLTAVPEAGYHLVAWGGAASGSANPLVLTMDGNKTVTATFAINTYTLTVFTVGTGTVSKSPNLATYTHGQTVNLTATPGTNYTFAGWSGDASGAANPLAVSMTSDKSITATFAINTYLVNTTVAPANSGSVTKNPSLAAYPHGSVVQLTAVPAIGYTFNNWSGNASGSTNPVSVTVNSTRNVTANFTLNSYTLTLLKIGTGSVSKSPNGSSYPHGMQVSISAIPGNGYRFAAWEGDTISAENPLLVPMTRSKTIIGRFVESTAPTVTVLSPNGGESMASGAATTLVWNATDNVGVTRIDVLLSRNGVAGQFETLADSLPNTGNLQWLVTGPATTDAYLMVRAWDAAGNSRTDVSNAAFTVTGPTAAIETGPVIAFALGAISPNPVRHFGRIHYALPHAARVRLTVVDVQGREIAVLAEGVLGAGRHETRWDGRDHAAGVYFVRFEAGGQRFMRRLVLAR